MDAENTINQLIDLMGKLLKEISQINDDDLRKENSVINLPADISEAIAGFKQINITLKSYSAQLLVLTQEISTNYYNQIDRNLNGFHPNLLQKYNSLYVIVKTLLNEIKRINYLLLIRDNNVILVGGNGSGKSSFASYLKESLSNNIVVIPAQKFLFYNKMIGQLHLTTKTKINDIQKDNLIRRGKFEDPHQDYEVQQFMNELSELFSKLVTVIANEQTKEEHELLQRNKTSPKDKEQTILHRLNSLWKTLIPDIELELDTLYRALVPIKRGKEYSLNSLSDGEKAMLYYICHVLLAEENSFIVIDEPETFLNVSNFNRLWDTLESYRPDCKFIYISHVIDFIVTRSNADLLWCKAFHHPNEWEINNIQIGEDLLEEFPKELLSEILGARKPILFCEGKKDSLDYFVYSSLFREDAVVCPVDGHNQVIQYTRAYNNSPTLNSNQAYGIIDSDLMNEQQIKEYENDYIYTLPFNEIEMIFITEDVLNNVLEHNFLPELVIQKVDLFKSECFKIVEKDKNRIVGQKIKKYIDSQVSKYRVNNPQQSGAEMINEIKQWLDELSILELEKDFSEEVERITNENDYESLLKISPQKKEISKGLANKFLDNNYEDKAITRIKQDRGLALHLKSKYFSGISFQ